MSHYIAKLGLVIAGIINLLPLLGLISAARLERLYGVDISNPDLEVLMRHRAVLFGIVGAFLFAAVFQPSWQTPAITAGLVSMVSFIVLTMMVKGYTGAYRHIVILDVIGIAALLIAIAAIYLTAKS